MQTRWKEKDKSSHDGAASERVDGMETDRGPGDCKQEVQIKLEGQVKNKTTETPKENKTQITRPRDRGPVAGNEASTWLEPGENLRSAVAACWSWLSLFPTTTSLLSQPARDGVARANKARKVTSQKLSEMMRLASDAQLVVCCFHSRRRKK